MSTARVHELKTWPAYFECVWDGEKTFEVRLDDRGFQKGDQVVLREWDRHRTCLCPGGDHSPGCTKYTGRSVTARIGHVMASTPPRGSSRGFVGMGYVVFSLCDPLKVTEAPTPAGDAIRRVAAAAGGPR